MEMIENLFINTLQQPISCWRGGFCMYVIIIPVHVEPVAPEQVYSRTNACTKHARKIFIINIHKCHFQRFWHVAAS